MSEKNDNLEGALEMGLIEIVGHDIGFGDNKVVAGSFSGGISKLFKFPSAVAPVSQSEHFKDSRVIEMAGTTYYVGEDAMKVDTSLIQDVIEYKHLEMFQPLFIHYALRRLGCNDKNYPKVYVLGLSVAHIDNSGYFKERAEAYFKAVGWKTQVVVLAQGAGVKLAHDVYGTCFPKSPEDFSGSSSNYLIADIGFNTLDVIQVLNGKVTPSNVRGIPNRGAVVPASKLHEFIKRVYGKEYSVKEVKEFMDKGQMTIRGQVLPLQTPIAEFRTEYLAMLEQIMEAEFGKIMDKMDFILLSGGGAYYFVDQVKEEKFYRVSGSHSEYYNSIGYFEHGKKLYKVAVES